MTNPGLNPRKARLQGFFNLLKLISFFATILVAFWLGLKTAPFINSDNSSSSATTSSITTKTVTVAPTTPTTASIKKTIASASDTTGAKPTTTSTASTVEPEDEDISNPFTAPDPDRRKLDKEFVSIEEAEAQFTLIKNIRVDGCEKVKDGVYRPYLYADAVNDGWLTVKFTQKPPYNRSNDFLTDYHIYPYERVAFLAAEKHKAGDTIKSVYHLYFDFYYDMTRGDTANGVAVMRFELIAQNYSQTITETVPIIVKVPDCTITDPRDSE